MAHDIGSTTSPDAAQAGWETGTWKLNLAQSKFDPGPPPRSMTITYEDRGDGVQVYTFEGIGTNGRPFFNSYTYKYDGTQYPSPDTGIGTIGPTTNTYKRVDAFTVEITARERVSQKVTQVTTRTLSQDRKSMTFRNNLRPGQVGVFDSSSPAVRSRRAFRNRALHVHSMEVARWRAGALKLSELSAKAVGLHYSDFFTGSQACSQFSG